MEGKPITAMPHDFCEINCKQFDPWISSKVLCADEVVMLRRIELHCKNEDVCKKWAEKKTPP